MRISDWSSDVCSSDLLTTDKCYTLTADVPYDREHHLTLDVYSPHNVQNAPVVVFFFGRRWQQGDKSQYKFVGQALAAQGFLAVIPNYRLSPQVRFQIGRAHVCTPVTNAHPVCCL